MSKTTTKDQVREQAMIVLADYATCKADGFHPDEGDGRREGEEIAKRIVDNYMILARPKKRPEIREQEIADLLYSEAKAHRDQWGYCRKHAVRSEAADAIIGILYKREPKPGPLMTPAERSALRLVRNGADVYDYGTAMHLRALEKRGLVSVVKAVAPPSGEKRQPYFGAIVTKAGLAAIRGARRGR